MALGIDSAAHEGALEAAANTIAVLAVRPGRPVPAQPSRRCTSASAQRAAVISELPPGATPYRWGFPARNRIIAALAQTVVVVEAAERSGSLITADIGITLGRDIARGARIPGELALRRDEPAAARGRDASCATRVDVLDSLAEPAPADLAVGAGRRPERAADRSARARGVARRACRTCCGRSTAAPSP